MNVARHAAVARRGAAAGLAVLAGSALSVRRPRMAAKPAMTGPTGVIRDVLGGFVLDPTASAPLG